MDRSIYAVWYDLSEEDKSGYLAWLHDDYFPNLLERPGYLWAAHYEITGGGSGMNKLTSGLERLSGPEIGSGTNFVAIIGAESPHVFFNPLIFQSDNPLANRHHDTGDQAVQKMLAKRAGARQGVYTEQERVEGPEIGQRPVGTCPGPAIQFGSFLTKTIQDEYDLAAWYAQYRFPAIAKMPGSIGARKMVAVAGPVKHCILYEYTSLEARLKNFEEHETLGLNDGEWTHRIVNYTIHSPGSPSVGRRIWPEVE
ncbi:MAG: hypothetical protein HQM13_02750 [SAR324 cluster bacterium]|nr:hypothetical protein [SAR324 cluster bacterium]